MCAAAEDPLLAQWRRIAARIDGTVGAAALDFTTGRRISLHGGDRFPMASICKLPIASHMMALVQEGKHSLAQEIEIPLYDVVPTVSPIAARWPKQKRFPLDEMLELMVAASDNTAVQTLFRIGGGEPAMSARFKQWDIMGLRVDRNERECGLTAAGVRTIPPVEEWTPDMPEKLEAKISPQERLAAMRRFLNDPRDTATPDATVEFLRKLYRGELLNAQLTARLIAILEKTTTGPARIKGMLPAGTVVAHKTGTTGSAGNLNGSTNDVGVINGKLAIAVFVKGSTRPLPQRERVIAEIAKTLI